MTAVSVAKIETDLGPFLEAAHQRYQGMEWISSDPLSAVYPYERPIDREVVAFLAAGLAFGNVKAMLPAIARVTSRLGDHPAETLKGLTRVTAGRLTRGFQYRWIYARDMSNLLLMLGGAVRNHGGLEPLFARGMSSSAEDVLGGAATLVAGLAEELPDRERKRRGTRYFLTDVKGASASKRIHMFLRWMIRSERPDLGLWTSAEPRQLLMPLDTHTARIARYLGLTERRGNGRATVLEITRALREVDGDDPVRFDFALSRLGILGHCRKRRDPEVCPQCPLDGVCQL